jgi:hypothetical protein
VSSVGLQREENIFENEGMVVREKSSRGLTVMTVFLFELAVVFVALFSI